MTCWACELARGERKQHKTRWFRLTPEDGIVCEDLNAKGFDLRLLYVPPEHKHCYHVDGWGYMKARNILREVAAYLPGYVVVSFDLADHSYAEHYHAQAGLRRIDG